MKICFVITRGDEFGGAQTHVRYLATEMHNTGNDVTVVTGTLGLFTDQLLADGIPVLCIRHIKRPINILIDALAVLSLYRHFRSIKYDVITAHSSKAGVITAIAASCCGKPFVFTAHSWPFLQGLSRQKNRFYLLLCRIIGVLATRIICVSEHDCRIALTYGVTSVEAISVIHNGVPDIPVVHHEISTRNLPTMIVMVARLAHPKDHDLVLRAIVALPDTHLLIVGDGPNYNQIQRRIEALSLESRVTLLGEVANVCEILSKADILVLISKSEGFPLAVLEGMRAALPIIASNVGGISEAIDDGIQGYLIQPDDKQGLTEKIRLLSTQDSLRLEMGKLARKRFQELFLLQTMINRTLSVYRQVLR